MVSTPNPNEDRPVTMADLRWAMEQLSSQLNTRIDDLRTDMHRGQLILLLLYLALLGGMISVIVAVFT